MVVMVEPETRPDVPAWALRTALGLCVLTSVPLYMVFLHTAAHRWALQLEPGDFTRSVLPFTVPAAAAGFTLLAAQSWWFTLWSGRPFLLGRTGWWFVLAFVVVLSVAAGLLGAKGSVGFNDVLLTAMMTGIGLVGLWLLPPAFSPRLLDGLPRRGRRTRPSS